MRYQTVQLTVIASSIQGISVIIMAVVQGNQPNILLGASRVWYKVRALMKKG